MNTDKTNDHMRAQRILDAELDSIASKDYNPNKLKLRNGATDGFLTL